VRWLDLAVTGEDQLHCGGDEDVFKVVHREQEIQLHPDYSKKVQFSLKVSDP
jgi:hypothetical protein